MQEQKKAENGNTNRPEEGHFGTSKFTFLSKGRKAVLIRRTQSGRVRRWAEQNRFVDGAGIPVHSAQFPLAGSFRSVKAVPPGRQGLRPSLPPNVISSGPTRPTTSATQRAYLPLGAGRGPCNDDVTPGPCLIGSRSRHEQQVTTDKEGVGREVR